PQGRGRMVPRLLAKAAPEIAKTVCAEHIPGCSLSPRERVRVRGNNRSPATSCRVSKKLLSMREVPDSRGAVSGCNARRPVDFSVRGDFIVSAPFEFTLRLDPLNFPANE